MGEFLHYHLEVETNTKVPIFKNNIKSCNAPEEPNLSGQRQFQQWKSGLMATMQTQGQLFSLLAKMMPEISKVEPEKVTQPFLSHFSRYSTHWAKKLS